MREGEACFARTETKKPRAENAEGAENNGNGGYADSIPAAAGMTGYRHEGEAG